MITSPSRQNSDIPPSSRGSSGGRRATIKTRTCWSNALDLHPPFSPLFPAYGHQPLAAISASSTPASSNRPPSASNLRKDRRTVLRKLLLRDWSNSFQGLSPPPGNCLATNVAEACPSVGRCPRLRHLDAVAGGPLPAKVHLYEGLYQDLRNQIFPSLPDEHIEIVCWSSTHEEQLAEAKPITCMRGATPTSKPRPSRTVTSRSS